jgi:hypothetical protein
MMDSALGVIQISLADMSNKQTETEGKDEWGTVDKLARPTN